jgi:hypothetical protein
MGTRYACTPKSFTRVYAIPRNFYPPGRNPECGPFRRRDEVEGRCCADGGEGALEVECFTGAAVGDAADAIGDRVY